MATQPTMNRKTRSKSFSHSDKSPKNPPNEVYRTPGLACNVAALLDDIRTKQLVSLVIPKTTYESRHFELVGISGEAHFDPPMPLCTPCKQFVTSPPPPHQGDQMKRDGITWHYEPHYWKPHHETLFQLIDCCYGGGSGTDGPQSCVMCQMFLRSILNLVPNDLGAEDRTRFDELRKTYPAHLDYSGGLRMSRVMGKGIQWHTWLYLNISIPVSGWRTLESQWVAISCEPGTKEDKTMEFGALPESTSSAETFASVQEWLENCLQGHPHWDHDPLLSCSRSGSDDSPFLPTRLIYIDDLHQKIRIIDPRGPKHQLAGRGHQAAESESHGGQRRRPGYMALSYRWGKAPSASNVLNGCPMLLLTRTTEAQLRAGIPYSAVPQTILDACTVVSRLGYSYLWVDRLCIFQDSSQDWLSEASQMGSIYGNSVLTIAASCARDERSGFLRRRTPKPEGIIPFTLRRFPFAPPPGSPPEEQPVEDRDGSDEPYYYMYGVSPLRPTGRCRDGFLVNRGWCFQEEVLSPRFVFFAAERVGWICQQVGVSEGLPLEHHPKNVAHNIRRLGNIKGWHSAIETYSVRELTYASDTLPAIAGIARDIQKNLRGEEDEYLGGLWKSTFLLDLLWKEHGIERRKKRQYIAPTWSWATFQAPLNFSCSHDLVIPLAEVVDIQLLHTGHDPFGAIQDGWLALRGSLVPITVQEIPKFLGSGIGQQHLRVDDADGAQLPPNTLFSGGTETLVSSTADGIVRGQVFCLPINKKEEGLPECHCLLLMREGSVQYSESQAPRKRLEAPENYRGQVYQRVGWLHMELNWMQSGRGVERQENERLWLLALDKWMNEGEKADILIR